MSGLGLGLLSVASTGCGQGPNDVGDANETVSEATTTTTCHPNTLVSEIWADGEWGVYLNRTIGTLAPGVYDVYRYNGYFYTSGDNTSGAYVTARYNNANICANQITMWGAIFTVVDRGVDGSNPATHWGTLYNGGVYSGTIESTDAWANNGG
jgi:hypothetical protein